ncbi:hypothetical protein NE237_001617 [Protea cynaroides]|uniref:Uncharacterized protein n=1 Tax=Protea cynaroides TaxID=273540 RepID=A0A9Q0KTP3_9MAGN|nr:hypothetical protein NE237_001617 [Protea cynaroides]
MVIQWISVLGSFVARKGDEKSSVTLYVVLHVFSNNRFSNIEFPVNLNRRNDDQLDPVSSDDKRVAIDEMDFFSDKNRSQETGLHLLTAANTGSDQSMVDDGISPNAEEKRGKKEHNEKPETIQEHEMLDGKLEENKHEISGGGGFMVPIQFMDLRPAATAETDEPSPQNNLKVASRIINLKKIMVTVLMSCHVLTFGAAPPPPPPLAQDFFKISTTSQTKFSVFKSLKINTFRLLLGRSRKSSP